MYCGTDGIVIFSTRDVHILQVNKTAVSLIISTRVLQCIPCQKNVIYEIRYTLREAARKQ